MITVRLTPAALPPRPAPVHYVRGPLSRVLGKVRRLSDPDMQAEIAATDRFLADLKAERHRDWLASLPPACRERQGRFDHLRKAAAADAAESRLRARLWRADRVDTEHGGESARYRFAQHAAAAARDRAAMERDRFREQLDRHATDAEHDQVIARLRRLR